MKKPILRNTALVAAMAAITATAWAANEALYAQVDATAAPVVRDERPVYTEVEREVAAESVEAKAALDANETVVTEREATVAAPAAAPLQAEVPQAPVTVEERRLTRDERIQEEVIARLASHPHLSGRIGVTTQDAVVTLTGYTSTAGQAQRAGREARNVDGVRAVENQIRGRIGGSV